MRDSIIPIPMTAEDLFDVWFMGMAMNDDAVRVVERRIQDDWPSLRLRYAALKAAYATPRELAR